MAGVAWRKGNIMKKLCCLLLCALMLLSLCACGAKAPATEVRVGAMTGPTSMGMVKLMSDSDAGKTEGSYSFELKTEPSAFVPALANGEIDIAAVPANLSSVIYNNTKGGIRLLALNALGVLYIVERGETVSALTDLSGRKLYATGQGAAPEFGLRWLLEKNGISGTEMPDIVWCADTSEALARLSEEESAVAMLPQPFATAAQNKIADLRVALDLNAEWQKVGDGSAMVTGVIVARTEFLEAHPEAVELFLKEYAASVEYVKANVADAAQLIGGYEIVAAPVAEKALPYCGLACVTGAEMKTMMEGYLSALHGFEPKSVGGALPAADFYYNAGK